MVRVVLISENCIYNKTKNMDAKDKPTLKIEKEIFKKTIITFMNKREKKKENYFHFKVTRRYSQQA